MRTYESKEELIAEIQKRYEKYDEEFESIPERLKDKQIEEVDKSPSENLSYQLGWVNLLLQWEKEEQAGKIVKTPAPGYKWNNLGGLYQSFYEKYGKYSIAEQREMLRIAVDELCTWLSTLSDQELFEPAQRKYATTKAMWPIYKWVHINTVAPFTNFRTKIRKWKKLVL
ncbi:ClbS/DfsB family four-helix bundle protein [Candidatus Enterococcus mansonii]|uniref:IRC4 n=1 Tax=Candidatus Enterococcus mansonii TaxID=1834181 RepID=A0A242CEH4_9ENTE|nr:ClbS/DfsB family four-helix bundle protein [Enterococcus sp. 4G2_DIV0659]OTO08611.1 IRC4 protein [Enterococcus sp. 4G2_DIV0659]